MFDFRTIFRPAANSNATPDVRRMKARQSELATQERAVALRLAELRSELDELADEAEQARPYARREIAAGRDALAQHLPGMAAMGIRVGVLTKAFQLMREE